MSTRPGATGHSLVETMLDEAIRMGDSAAERTLREALIALEDAADATSTLHRLIDERGRAAALIASTDPDAATRFRHEAEVLTIALARIEHSPSRDAPPHDGA